VARSSWENSVISSGEPPPASRASRRSRPSLEPAFLALFTCGLVLAYLASLRRPGRGRRGAACPTAPEQWGTRYRIRPCARAEHLTILCTSRALGRPGRDGSGGIGPARGAGAGCPGKGWGPQSRSARVQRVKTGPKVTSCGTPFALPRGRGDRRSPTWAAEGSAHHG